ncbi:protein LST8 homolog [Lycorma delicatula]|uniref:protein LST8 homolog n=1 Tax=Lycorma delicatula TaxID=130591 RepID=UPI003F5140B8
MVDGVTTATSGGSSSGTGVVGGGVSGGSGDQVILATGGYDYTIKLWQAHSGVYQRTMQHADSVSLYE